MPRSNNKSTSDGCPTGQELGWRHSRIALREDGPSRRRRHVRPEEMALFSLAPMTTITDAAATALCRYQPVLLSLIGSPSRHRRARDNGRGAGNELLSRVRLSGYRLELLACKVELAMGALAPARRLMQEKVHDK